MKTANLYYYDMKIDLVLHNPCWALEFESEKAAILSKFPDAVVHHVGSTAVEDLRAKPVIDISIESRCFPPTERDRAALKSLGYINMGEAGVPGRVWFTKGQPRKFNLHFCPTGSDVVRSQLAFRDALRKNEHLRREYEDLKKRFAPGEDIDSATYAKAKDQIIRQVIRKERPD